MSKKRRHRPAAKPAQPVPVHTARTHVPVRHHRTNRVPMDMINYFFGGGGAYEGAGIGRVFKNWQYSQGVADAEILGDLPALRERSRDLYRNNPIGRGVINTMVTNVIGSGIRLQAAPDRTFLGLTDDYAETWEDNVERKFNNWANSKDCDSSRMSTFYDIQNLAFLSYCQSGEVFALLPVRTRGKTDQLCIQLVEADLVQNGPGQFTGKDCRDGIELNDDGEPISYTIRTDTVEWQKILAYGAKTNRPNIIHVFRQERPGQSRGVPMLASVIENIKQADRGSKAVLASMVVQSLFAAFIKSTNPNALAPPIPQVEGSITSESTYDDDELDYTLAPGAVMKLKPEEDVTFANPNQPKSEFEAFMMAHLVWIGMATGIPYEILSKKFLASYSASRASRIEAWRFFLAERSKFNRDFNQIIYKEWLTFEILSNRIPAPGFFNSIDIQEAYCRAEWLGSSMGQIDEQKEVAAAWERVQHGFSTFTQETAAMNGGDFTRNAKRLNREAALIGPVLQLIMGAQDKTPSDTQAAGDDADNQELGEGKTKQVEAMHG